MRRTSVYQIVFLAILFPSNAFTGFNVITSPSLHVSELSPSKTTGLEAIFVVEDGSESKLTYTTSGSNRVTWKKFSQLGGGYAESIENVTYDGQTSSILLGDSDMGYIVEDNNRQIACWVVNYANHIPTISHLEVSGDSDCDRVFLNPTGGFDKITYFSINGQPIELDRKIVLHYNNLQENDDKDGWALAETEKNYPSITGVFSTEAPLCNANFTLIGDQFMKEWGSLITVTTGTFETHRVSAITSAVQDERSNDNESGSSDGLGGSAPCEITFKAIPTDAVVFREWQFSTMEDFGDIVDRYNQDEFTHTFNEYGTTFVKYVAADNSGECIFESDIYTISVGESKLECPNAFSPLNEDGVNDEWKVSYSSLTSFECHIFNRWGTKVFSTTNPAEGWDGRYNGKFVKPGVFFYVIKATGADGHKYNLSGDINIIGSRLNPNYGFSAE